MVVINTKKDRKFKEIEKKCNERLAALKAEALGGSMVLNKTDLEEAYVDMQRIFEILKNESLTHSQETTSELEELRKVAEEALKDMEPEQLSFDFTKDE